MACKSIFWLIILALVVLLSFGSLVALLGVERMLKWRAELLIDAAICKLNRVQLEQVYNFSRDPCCRVVYDTLCRGSRLAREDYRADCVTYEYYAKYFNKNCLNVVSVEYKRIF